MEYDVYEKIFYTNDLAVRLKDKKIFKVDKHKTVIPLVPSDNKDFCCYDKIYFETLNEGDRFILPYQLL